MDAWMWIVIVVVVLLIVGALLAFGMQKKREAGREKAASIRTEVAQQSPGLHKREAEAQGAEAEAARMRAEADQLDLAAQEERARLQEEQAELDDRLRTADRLDPDGTASRPTSTSTTTSTTTEE
jgi:flagellar biosynthesis/type III secretory pathway M-ring protein FliF/YscJ